MRGEIRRIDGGKDAGKDGFFPPEGPPRRLAAILAADIAGYSRLMGIDEEGTHARVKRYRRELIDPAIAEHHGKLIKNTGDGFIAMFESPVEAVRCAVVIQQSMVGRNASLPRAQWVLYRIGVNLGDVIVEAEDIFGDGVNIAARLEGIAEPGDVYISGVFTSRSRTSSYAGTNRSAIARSRTSPIRSASIACCRIPPRSCAPAPGADTRHSPPQS